MEEAAAPLEAAARDALSAARPGLPRALSRLTALADPTRLDLLVAIHAAPGVPVKALAAATGQSPNTTTQALTALREAGLVSRVREGRLARYYLVDEVAHDLLHQLDAPHSDLHPTH